MPRCKRFLGFLLFAVLMLVKVSALHVYTHNDTEGDTIENCTTCEVALENQNSDILFTSGVIEVTTPDITTNSLVLFEDQQFVATKLNSLLFSRPPPAFLS
nr:hypothetical protein [uncultured Allomuricauda sp.]